MFTSLFMYTTGVSSIKDLRYYLESVAKREKITGPSVDDIRYQKATQGMSLSEELDYVYNKYISSDSGLIDTTSLDEDISEEELLKWESENASRQNDSRQN